MSANKDVVSAQTVEDEVTEDSVYSKHSKLLLTDAVEYFKTLLKENNLIISQCSNSISHEAMLMDEEIYKLTVDMLAEKNLVTDEELIHVNEVSDEIVFESVEVDSSSEEKKSKMEHIPLDYKLKVVNMAKKHPTWSFKTLQSRGCGRLVKKEYLSRWEEDIKKGGTIFDKYAIIDSWTYDRFVEARQNYQQVTTNNLQQ